MSKAMTRKAWLEYLQKAVDEFDWDAVEQAQCEPVAWMDAEGDVYRKEPPEGWCPPHIPLYAHTKREWVGLTDEEIQYCENLRNPEAIVEEVEAKLKEKNT